MQNRWPATAKLGRGFCRAIKVFPPLFLIVVAAGLGVGVFLTFVAFDASPIKLGLFRLLGAACFLFYGTLLWLFISRQISGTWDEMCNYGEQIFADQPAWRIDLTSVEEVDQHPVDIGISIQRVQEFFGANRSLLVFVDDKEVGRLRIGARRQFAVSPGRHHMHVQMDWCSSSTIQIDVSPSCLVNLHCGTRFRHLFPLNMVGIVIWPGRCFFVEIDRGSTLEG